MPRLHKIITITFVLYMLLCIPALAAQHQVGDFVSNTPTAAGPNASIGEVWMRHGGARLQYDALMGSVQMNTNGRLRRDPAAVTHLPPLYPVQRVTRKKDTPATAEQKKSEKKTAPKVNPSHKPSVSENDSNKEKDKDTTKKETVPAPYSGAAPSVAPSAQKEATPSNAQKNQGSTEQNTTTPKT